MGVSLHSLRAPSSVTDPGSGQACLALGLLPQPLAHPLDTRWGLMGLGVNSAAQGGGRAGLALEGSRDGPSAVTGEAGGHGDWAEVSEGAPFKCLFYPARMRWRKNMGKGAGKTAPLGSRVTKACWCPVLCEAWGRTERGRTVSLDASSSAAAQWK